MTQLRGNSLSVDQLSDQLTGTAISGYSSLGYDYSGEVTGFNGNTASYNPFGQMATISGTAVGSSKTFSNAVVYDHLGRRASLAESISGAAPNSDVQSFVFDGSDVVYREFSGYSDDQVQFTLLDQPDFETVDNGLLYIYGPTGLVMEFDRSGYNTRTMLFDPNGSCVATVNGATSIYSFPGSAAYPVFYDAYGQPVWTPPTQNTFPAVLNRATAQPFQYKGQYGYYTDGATGLSYCLNRYYDPLVGRWTSRDPTGLDGGVNVYAYVQGDPVLGCDPTGLDGLILYGPDKASGDRTWKDIATEYARLYNDLHFGSTAKVQLITNLADFNRALGTTKKIDTLIYIGHSGVDGSYPGPAPLAHLYLAGDHSGSADISSTDIGALNTSNVKAGAFILLVGCGTAALRNQPRVGEFDPVPLALGTPTLAQAFAKRFRTDVFGFEPHVTPGPVPFWGSRGFHFKNFLGTQYFHNGRDTVFPVVVHP